MVLFLRRGARWNVFCSSPGFWLCGLLTVPPARHSENEKHAAGDHSWGVCVVVCRWAGAGLWKDKNRSGPASAALAGKCFSSCSLALLAALQFLKQIRGPYNQISPISLNVRDQGKWDALGLCGKMQILRGAEAASLQSGKNTPP